jgi:hypothetical protein
MQGKLCNMPSIAVKGTVRLPGEGDFLFEFFIELSKPFYPGASLLNQVLILFFFFITLRLRN